MALVLTACGSGFPKDPEGTLDRVRADGLLVAGAVPAEPMVTLPEGVDGEPAGTEVELVEDFATGLGAEVEWTVGGETELFEQLERGEIDLVVGGLTAKTPYAGMAAITRPYDEVRGVSGVPEPRVMAVRAGENATLVALERFLDEHGGSS